ncbi:membrane protein [Paenibacillus nasutitermitis]|uniref:Membrane protein n=2 Tax=Paenibacillus nasutitermitis TaxID=1652958 RepID=A0A917DR80_9BACL|nr:membrane protein [Paenibacillus nasutitermitis]
MYAVETTLGKYAIKALNPQIMQRPEAMQNFLNSEHIATIAANHTPALPAKIIDGTPIHEMDNQFYLVFNWADGESLKPDQINNDHCEQIGTILAVIHKTDFSEIALRNYGSGHSSLTDWNVHLRKGQENNTDWVNPLQEIIDKLYEWNAQANKSAEILTSETVISHRDLDPKNVLWCRDNPILIDWEAAGLINPMQDLLETAIYWSENETGSMDKKRFLAFIDGYKKLYGTLQANWRLVLESGFSGKLGWLDYNLKRSLGMECSDEDEQQMGTNQVNETIHAIKRYADMIPELESWMHLIQLNEY